MDSNITNDDEFERILEMSRQEFNTQNEYDFENEIETALQESKTLFNSNLSIPEKDIIDNIGEPVEEEEDYDANYIFKINVLPLSVYPWDDDIIDYLETSNTFIGTKYLLGQITQKNLFEHSELLAFKFNDKNVLTPHDFIISDDCYIPSRIFNELGLTLDDTKETRQINIEFINNIEKGTKIILRTNDKHFVDIKDQKKLCDENVENKFKVITQGQTISFYSSDLLDFINFECIHTNNNGTIKITETDLEVEFVLTDELIKKLNDEKEKAEQIRMKKMIENINESSSAPSSDNTPQFEQLTKEELRERRLKYFQQITHI